MEGEERKIHQEVVHQYGISARLCDLSVFHISTGLLGDGCYDHSVSLAKNLQNVEGCFYSLSHCLFISCFPSHSLFLHECNLLVQFFQSYNIPHKQNAPFFLFTLEMSLIWIIIFGSPLGMPLVFLSFLIP